MSPGVAATGSRVGNVLAYGITDNPCIDVLQVSGMERPHQVGDGSRLRPRVRIPYTCSEHGHKLA